MLPDYERIARASRSRSSNDSSSDAHPRCSSESDPNEFEPFHEDVNGNGELVHDDDVSEEDIHEEIKLVPISRPRRSNKQSRPREFKAFAEKGGSRRPLSKLSRWLIPKRICCIALLVFIAGVVLLLGAGGLWVYKKATIDGQSPPWYPTPRGGTSKKWEKSYNKASKMVAQMNLVEKVNLTTGTGWMMGMCVGNTGPATGVGFPSLCLQDGPLGLRFADNITASPAGITVGATWNKELMYKRGKMLGLEARLKGVNVLLGPSVGPLGRMPAGGRNWEGFGSDPVLQGIAAVEMIKGIQEEGVMATIKHFVGNEQEHFRTSLDWGLPHALSSNIDDRTLHELYVWPFADTIRAGVASVMCSYNQVNNSYACQNSKLLNGILKDELGFQGFVQSDWLAQRSGVASAIAGLDLSMPGDGTQLGDGISFWGPHLTLATLNGTLPMDRLDDMVTRIVAAWYQLGQGREDLWPLPGREDEGGPNFSSWTNDEVGLLRPGSDDNITGVVNQYVIADGEGGFSHSALVRRIAAEGIVMLKNANDFLPLDRNGSSQDSKAGQKHTKVHIAIFGTDACQAQGGPNVCADRGCNIGTLASGWGSGAVEFPYLVTPLEALQQAFHEDQVELTIFPTNELPSLQNATQLGQQDLCIAFVNSTGGEGYIVSDGIKGDRNDLNLQNGGDELIRDIAANCGTQRFRGSTFGIGDDQARTRPGTTIVVIHSVGPVILESFIEDPNIRAVLLANLPGQESGNALADVLFGHLNPSGHLPYTIGKSPEDYGLGARVMYYPNSVIPQQDFDEGLLIDYRWFDAMKLMPRYEFGYGMSYTTFSLEHLAITPTNTHKAGPLPAKRPEQDCSPPNYDSAVPDASEAVFPKSWRKLKKYIYAYIDSADDIKFGRYPYPEIEQGLYSQAGGGEGGNPALWDTLVKVHVTVSNEGERDGQAVVQLYVVFPEDVYEEVDDVEPDLPGEDDLGERRFNDFDDVNDLRSDAKGMDWDDGTNTTVMHHNSAYTTVSLSSSSSPTSTSTYPFPTSTRQISSTDPNTFSRSEKITFPPRVLRGFEKLHLRGSASSTSPPFSSSPSFENGGKEKLELRLTRRDLSYWSVRRQNWVLPRGVFGVEVGFSSRDLRVRGRVEF